MRNLPSCSVYNRRKRYVLNFALLMILLAVLFAMNICMGSVSVSLPDMLEILSGSQDDSVAHGIVWKIRFPRACAAMLLGGALSLSGYLLQTFFHNPIAGPFVLGISSGAKLFVAIVMIVFLQHSVKITSISMTVAAFAGSIAAMGLVLLLSRKISSRSGLVVGGIMIGYICSAATEFLITFARESDIVNLHNWSMGSFSGISWQDVRVMTVIVLMTFLAVFCMSKPIHAYQLGEGYAANMGVNIPCFRGMLVLLSSILSACVTAFAGPVSFVGIAVPQLVKWLFKTSRPLLIIPAGFLGGSVFCLFCDLVARMLFAPTELSISAVTAVLGAPVVIAVMLSGGHESGE